MLNKVQLIARLGKDVESKQVNSQTVANFSVATTEKWKDKSGEKKESTDWHNIVIWGALADICVKYLHKGDLVFLEGKIKNRSYTDKQGVTKYVTEIICHEMKMLVTKGGENSAPAASSEPIISSSTDMSDLPF